MTPRTRSSGSAACGPTTSSSGFAESTRVGVVALVDGDVRVAYERLHGTYGVTVVARSDDEDEDHLTGFQQVRELVDSICR
ncbi:MAG: hypothetical protein JWR27_150 [Aeromicrobium sp.]|jgi:hypothetical protein|nr:hypothetical protein [Aeromicrobium sp.]